MKGFLDYLPGNSILHKMHPLSKIFLSILICAAAFTSANYYMLIGLILLNLLLGFIGNGKPGCGLFRRSLGLLKGLSKMSIFLFILQVLLVRRGNILLHFSSTYGITDEGIKVGLLLVLRLTSATLPLSIMISVTNLNDLANTMVKTLHIPYKFAFTLTSAIRFIPVFSSEMTGIIESQKARGVDFDVKNPFKKIGMILPLCFPLLLASIRKIEFTATAAELRGFYLRNRKSCSKVYKYHFVDFAFTLLGFAVLAGAILINIFC